MMIMKLRKSNLRQMLRTGLINDRIKKKVLRGLKQIVKDDSSLVGVKTHGDLKEADHCYLLSVTLAH